jgi:hypothetical protein
MRAIIRIYWTFNTKFPYLDNWDFDKFLPGPLRFPKEHNALREVENREVEKRICQQMEERLMFSVH